MSNQVLEEPGPSRPQLRTVRRARNSSHDVPCGGDCLVYPTGKTDNTPQGFMGRVARYLELDLKTRPLKNDVWLEKKGKKRKHGGRHRECPRPNRYHPADAAGDRVYEAEANVDAAENEAVERQDAGRRERARPADEGRPANEVAMAWRRRDSEERRRVEEARAAEEPRREGAEHRREDEGQHQDGPAAVEAVARVGRRARLRRLLLFAPDGARPERGRLNLA